MQHKLYNGNDAFAWHARRWPQFADDVAPETKLVIQPVYSIADWAMGRPLDAEEVVGSAVLNGALEATHNDIAALALPPIRYTPRQSRGTAFHLDIEVAHQVLIQTVRSAARSGLQRFVLFNTSPFLEEWIDVAARDLRVDYDLQLFCVNLSGVGLDFHPIRGGPREGLDSILTELLGCAAEPVAPKAGAELDLIPSAAVKTNPPHDRHENGAGALLAQVVADLARLLREIETHPPLNPAQPSKEENT
ncbi:MAG: creatininase family protein [Verrucomicrobia bacterium]|jgi:hypothetical protein|nr:creatininase family protein [Verrucomicrobiota bacterium]